MESVKNLNAIIEKELTQKQFDDVQKIQELLAIAEQLYEKVCNAVIQYQNNEISIATVPEEVKILSDNIMRLMQKLLEYGIDISHTNEEVVEKKR